MVRPKNRKTHILKMTKVRLWAREEWNKISKVLLKKDRSEKVEMPCRPLTEKGYVGETLQRVPLHKWVNVIGLGIRAKEYISKAREDVKESEVDLMYDMKILKLIAMNGDAGVLIEK